MICQIFLGKKQSSICYYDQCFVLKYKERLRYKVLERFFVFTGEPIMYPKINEMVDLLHSKKISSFLVTNAQFPDAIR